MVYPIRVDTFLHRRVAEFAELLLDFRGVLCASAVKGKPSVHINTIEGDYPSFEL